MKSLSTDLRQSILRMKKNGKGVREIAKNIGHAPSTISKILKDYRIRGNLQPRKSTGRPRKTTKRQDHKIKRAQQADPFKSAVKINAEFPDLKVSNRTVQRRVLEFGLFSRRPAKKPLITKKNQKSRLRFAIQHQDWTVSLFESLCF